MTPRIYGKTRTGHKRHIKLFSFSLCGQILLKDTLKNVVPLGVMICKNCLRVEKAS